MRLRHAVSTVEGYGETTQANNLDDARHRLEELNQPLDLIFISYEFPREEVLRFIREGKDRAAAENAAFVMLFAGNENKDSRISEGLLAGVDGFLFEPFSCDDLVGMGALAAKIKQQRTATRETLSIRFILKDLIRLVDVFARLTTIGSDTTKVLQRLLAINAAVEAFQPESKQAYFDQIVDAFTLQLVPDPALQRLKKEGIRSKRLLKKLGECLADGVEKHAKKKDELARRLPLRKIDSPL